MKVILKDLVTGETKEVDDPSTRACEWAEGNWSCDCNRAPYMLGHDVETTCNMGPNTTQRFRVMEVLEWNDSEGWTLEDLND